MKLISKINQSILITPKLLYLSIGLLIFTLHTFRVLFITEYIGIEKSEYSYIFGIISFIGFFSNILLGFISDKLNSPKYILLTLITICTICFQIIHIIKNKFNIFWLLMFIYTSFNNSMLPLLDRHMMEDMLPSLGVNINCYGSQRLWGAVAYPLSTFIIEQSIKSGNKYNFKPLSIYQGCMALISGIFVICFIKKNRLINYSLEKDNSSINIKNKSNTNLTNERDTSFINLLTNYDYIFFIFIVLLNGITRSAMTMFLTDYWNNSLKLEKYDITGYSKGFQYIIYIFNNNPVGTCTTFGVVFEIIILFYSQFITNKMGLYWPLLFAQIAQLIRFICYFIINSNYKHRFILCCLFETMKGINFALTHISAVHLAVFMCPSGLKNTSTMIYNGAFTGLSSVIAGIIFGILFKDLKGNSDGFNSFFMLNIIVCIASIVLFCIKYGYDGVLI